MGDKSPKAKDKAKKQDVQGKEQKNQNAIQKAASLATVKNWAMVARLIGMGYTRPLLTVKTRCWYPVKLVNRLTYSQTRSLDVWNRWAP